MPSADWARKVQIVVIYSGRIRAGRIPVAAFFLTILSPSSRRCFRTPRVCANLMIQTGPHQGRRGYFHFCVARILVLSSFRRSTAICECSHLFSFIPFVPWCSFKSFFDELFRMERMPETLGFHVYMFLLERSGEFVFFQTR